MSKGILIIAGARVGGSNLTRAIAGGAKSSYKFEIDLIDDWNIINASSDVCKYIPFLDHPDMEYDYDFNKSVNMDMVIKRAKQFNKTVIMNRRNKVEQTESLYALKINAKVFRKSAIFLGHDSKNIFHWDESQVDSKSSLYKNLYRYNQEMDRCLSHLSNMLGIEMDYYEDVYRDKRINDRSIELDYKYFSHNRKLRRISREKTIL